VRHFVQHYPRLMECVLTEALRFAEPCCRTQPLGRLVAAVSQPFTPRVVSRPQSIVFHPDRHQLLHLCYRRLRHDPYDLIKLVLQMVERLIHLLFMFGQVLLIDINRPAFDISYLEFNLRIGLTLLLLSREHTAHQYRDDNADTDACHIALLFHNQHLRFLSCTLRCFFAENVTFRSLNQYNLNTRPKKGKKYLYQ